MRCCSSRCNPAHIYQRPRTCTPSGLPPMHRSVSISTGDISIYIHMQRPKNQQKNRSDITPDPGGHRPQRPCAQGRTHEHVHEHVNSCHTKTRFTISDACLKQNRKCETCKLRPVASRRLAMTGTSTPYACICICVHHAVKPSLPLGEQSAALHVKSVPCMSRVCQPDVRASVRQRPVIHPVLCMRALLDVRPGLEVAVLARPRHTNTAP